MNKIEKLNESIRTLFRSEGEKFCYTPGEIGTAGMQPEL